VVRWDHPSQYSEQHHDRFSRFCRVHGRDRPTDRPRYTRLASAAMNVSKISELVAINSIANVLKVDMQCQSTVVGFVLINNSTTVEMSTLGYVNRTPVASQW